MPLNNMEEEIVRLLEKHPDGMMIKEITDSLNTNHQTISKYVYGLTMAGIVEYREVGRAKLYFLVKKGKEGKKGLVALSLIALILLAPAVLAQTQSHPLSEITPIDVNLNLTNVTGLNQNITGVGWLQYNSGIIFGSTHGIPTTDLQNLAVTTSKIALGAITNSLIANSAINGSQIQNGVIENSTLARDFSILYSNITNFPSNCTSVAVADAIATGLCDRCAATFHQHEVMELGKLGEEDILAETDIPLGALVLQVRPAVALISMVAPEFRLARTEHGEVASSKNTQFPHASEHLLPVHLYLPNPPVRKSKSVLGILTIIAQELQIVIIQHRAHDGSNHGDDLSGCRLPESDRDRKSEHLRSKILRRPHRIPQLHD